MRSVGVVACFLLMASLTVFMLGFYFFQRVDSGTAVETLFGFLAGGTLLLVAAFGILGYEVYVRWNGDGA